MTDDKDKERARKNLEDLNLSEDEVKKFEKAFQDPEFKKLFMEYAQEISDPKNRAESDAYLREMEMRGQVESVYGKGVQLMVPNAGFAAKTFDKKSGMKVFVNVCYSDKCEDAEGKRQEGGVNWSIPHTLGQPHKEEDKTGKECMAWDFAVSTKTYELCQGDERFKKMVVDTAIEAINRTNPDRELDTNFTMPKMKFKGPKEGPGVQAIRDKNAEGGEEPETTKDGRLRPKGNPQGGMSGVPESAPDKDAPKGKETASSFSFDKAVKRQPKPRKPEKEPNGECEPRYDVIHREGSASNDLSKTFGETGAPATVPLGTRERPNALVVRIYTPKIDSIAGAELDVSAEKVFFKVPDKYRLNLHLPYKVDSDDGKAKFDKAARKLEITLPVVAAPAPAPVPFTEPVVEEVEDDIVEVKAGGAESALAGEPEVEEEAGYVMVDRNEAKDAATTPMPGEDADEDEDERTGRGNTTAPKEAPAAAPTEKEEQAAAVETENERKWREMHKKPEPEPVPQPSVEAPVAGGASAPAVLSKEVLGAALAAAEVAAEQKGPATQFLAPRLTTSTFDDDLD